MKALKPWFVVSAIALVSLGLNWSLAKRLQTANHQYKLLLKDFYGLDSSFHAHMTIDPTTDFKSATAEGLSDRQLAAIARDLIVRGFKVRANDVRWAMADQTARDKLKKEGQNRWCKEIGAKPGEIPPGDGTRCP
jgi:hypothetical protein